MNTIIFQLNSSTMYSNFLQPCIIEPTRIVPGNRPSLVINIFMNIIDKNLYNGN